MDLTILIIGAGLLTGSLLLSIGVERIIRLIGVAPAAPDERSGGIRDVFSRLDQWRRQRETSERDSRG